MRKNLKYLDTHNKERRKVATLDRNIKPMKSKKEQKHIKQKTS